MTLRGHEPLVIENFGGLWDRGDPESAPSDHFIEAVNVQYFNSGFETRYPLDKYMASTLGNIIRTYDYVTQKGQTILALVSGGDIYHIVNKVATKILSRPLMEDFGFVAIAGRAYITPFKSYTDIEGQNYELGLQNDFVYVYGGDPTVPARKAAGLPPGAGTITLAQGPVGFCDLGFHVVAVVYETDTGYLTALGPTTFGTLNYTDALKSIVVSGIPTGDTTVVKRHLVSTKAITDYNGDQKGYQFFFIPLGNLDDNVLTTKQVSYYDSDLLDDASHLIDNFSEIPAGVNLNTFHSRLVVVGEYGTVESLAPSRVRTRKRIRAVAAQTDNRSVARVSAPGEPEAISKVDGLIIAPLDGNPLTNCQEFRDILYLTKKTRTYAYSDNQDEPSTWVEQVIDQAVGSPVHGIATVLDSGGVNVDFLLVADLSGLMLFNGVYSRPEMSWKIEDYWKSLDRNEFRKIQLINDSLNKKIYIILPPPERIRLLHANYGDGLDAKNIKWVKWEFITNMTSLTMIESDKLILGTNDGLYFINPAKKDNWDSYYPDSNHKIPDPMIRTAFLGA